MQCPSCSQEIQPGGVGCPFCSTLISAPEAGTLAGPARRLAGYILDLILWGLVFFGASVSFGLGAATGSSTLSLLSLLVPLALLVYCWARSTSPGKWLLGMRVFRVSGRPVGFLGMLVRETIGKFLSGMILSLGYLWILFDRDKQAWHDKLVGSVVVTRRASVPQTTASA